MEVGMAAGANKIGSELKGLGGIETLESCFDERMLANALVELAVLIVRAIDRLEGAELLGIWG